MFQAIIHIPTSNSNKRIYGNSKYIIKHFFVRISFVLYVSNTSKLHHRSWGQRVWCLTQKPQQRSIRHHTSPLFASAEQVAGRVFVCDKCDHCGGRDAYQVGAKTLVEASRSLESGQTGVITRTSPANRGVNKRGRNTLCDY